MIAGLIYKLIKKIVRASEDNIPKAYIMLFLPPDPKVVDAGAHVGGDSLEMSILWPKATIYAFEPVPKLFQQLVLNTRIRGNIQCYPFALAADTGNAALHISGDGGTASSSLLAPKETLKVNPKITFSEIIPVPTLSLDQWGQQNKCNSLDFLWLDMQGGELAMLRSSPLLLSTVQAIHLEVSVIELYEQNPLYAEVRFWLEQQGFRLEAEEIIPQCSGNAFFVREGVTLRPDRLLHIVMRKTARVLRPQRKRE